MDTPAMRAAAAVVERNWRRSIALIANLVVIGTPPHRRRYDRRNGRPTLRFLPKKRFAAVLRAMRMKA
jgi:hypothetical protein